MPKRQYVGVEQARSRLPALLDDATNGRSTVITRHGKSIAVIVPLDQMASSGSQLTLLSVAGSGKGLWGASSRITVRRLRDEWTR